VRGTNGEVDTAFAASKMNTPMILSTLTSRPMEEVAAAYAEDRDANDEAGPGLLMQLYVFKRRDLTEHIVRHAEKLGFRGLVLTVDAPCSGRRDRDMRNGFTVADTAVVLPNLAGLGGVAVSQLHEFEKQHDASLTWQVLAWLRSITTLPVIVKGILSPDDADLAISHGAAAIIISNHGGRQLDTVPATINVAAEIVSRVGRRVPVLLDGGIRRGSDIFKALAAGVDAVLLGRATLYGLAAGGQRGVMKMLTMLQTEFEVTMRLAGVNNIADKDKLRAACPSLSRSKE